MTHNVLVVDNNTTMLKTLSGLLKSESGLLNVFTATDGKQALELLVQHCIRVVITAIRIPTLDGFELLTTLSKNHPDVKVIVMTSGTRPMLRARIQRIPSAVYLDQAQDLSMLTKRVFTELQIDYGGRVRGINLSSFLQMMELESRTCTLKISCKKQNGTLWLENGELIAAQSLNETGKNAALQILAWKNVYIDIDYTPQPVTRDIFLPLMMLILESGQMDDEKRSGTADSRSEERYDLLIALDYNIHNITRHCALRDISLSGAYIETDENIDIGQQLSLTLTSPTLSSSCSVNATVVRKDAVGIGIRFTTSNPHQLKMIHTMIHGSVSTAPQGVSPVD